MNDFEVFAVGERDGAAAAFDVAFEGVEGNAGEGAAHLEAGEAGGMGGGFAVREDEGAEALAGPGGVHEDGADLGEGGGIGGVKCGGVAGRAGVRDGHGVAAAEGAAEAPAATGDEGLWGVGGSSDEVGLVGDELAVDAEGAADGGFDLGGGVIVGVEATDGGFYQSEDGGDIVEGGSADGEGGVRGHLPIVGVRV